MFTEPWIEYDSHNWPVDLLALRLRLQLIIWLCLTRTGNYKIHEFDWLKSILTAV